MKIAFLVGVVGFAGVASAQIPGIPGGGRIDLPGLEDILFKKEDPFTSSLKDAWVGCEFLDDLSPEFAKITQESRNAAGNWVLNQGAFRAEIRSFCGKGYTYGPTGGMGYGIAPWKGKHAQILQNLVRRYSLSNEDQEKTQILIWAILAKGKPSKFASDIKAVAAKLLKPEEIKQLEGFSVDALSDDVMRRLMGKADAALRPVYEAENKVRSMTYQANRPFQEMENLMVRTAPQELTTVIPKGRWLWHKNGYFFRVFPERYRKTVFEILVPRKPLIERDDKGRITRLESPPGYVTEVEYDAARPSEPCPDDAKLTIHYIKRTKISAPDPANPGQTLTVESTDPNFLFTGVPTAKDGVSLWSDLFASVKPTWQDWRNRFRDANTTRRRYNTYTDHAGRLGRIERGEATDEGFFDMNHYRDAAWELFRGRGLGWIGDHHSRQAEALAAATQTLDGLPTTSEVDPSDGVYMPGNPGSQRILGSSATW